MKPETVDVNQVPSISVLMVTYNSAHLLDNSIGPLVGQENIQVIVVDNASTDNTIEYLRSNFPTVQLISNDKNLGFGMAMNIAARHASGHTLVLLNPDAEIGHDVLLNLVARNRASRGVAAPLIKQRMGRLKIHSAGRFPTIWRMFLHYTGVSRLAKNLRFLEGHYLLPHRNEPTTINTDWVTGAILAIGHEDWNSIGGISERWFMYAEDIELCWRIKNSNLPVLLHTDLEAHHAVGESDASSSYSSNPAWIINLFDFYKWRINNNRFAAALWCVVVAIGLFSRSLAYSVQSKRAVGQQSEMWALETRKFRSYATSVLRLIKDN